MTIIDKMRYGASLALLVATAWMLVACGGGSQTDADAAPDCAIVQKDGAPVCATPGGNPDQIKTVQPVACGRACSL